jgi:murein DD-endopeptidase MepM/ murein hydrolase activator NlpD
VSGGGGAQYFLAVRATADRWYRGVEARTIRRLNKRADFMRSAVLAFIVALVAASSVQAGRLAAETERFSWPLCGPAPKAYGPGINPFTGRKAFHSGVDLDAPTGTPVRASAPGFVVAAEVRGPYGNMIEIAHRPGYRTRYGHLAAFRVNPGERVGRGQVIGNVGSTGRSKGPHLHFEIWYRDIVRDPRTYLEAEATCLLK